MTPMALDTRGMAVVEAEEPVKELPAPELVPEKPSPRDEGPESNENQKDVAAGKLVLTGPLVVAEPETAAPAGGLPSSLSADAPEFKPSWLSKHVAQAADDSGTGTSFRPTADQARLPPELFPYLRRFYKAETGALVAFYVGSLKSYNREKGYGFLESEQCKADWGGDVFLHKLWVPSRWHLGQFAEFAVTTNVRGQPQASNVHWLPLVPVVAKVANGATAAVAPAPTPVSAVRSRSPPDAGPPARAPRYLGTVKSFSPTNGYGFISCDQVSELAGRDIFMDRVQMSSGKGLFQGQVVEFSVAYSTRGEPQARQIDWDPVPRLELDPSNSTEDDNREALRALRTYSRSAYVDLCKLMRLINERKHHDAVILAVEIQGSAPEESLVDFIMFVLDRLGAESEVVSFLRASESVPMSRQDFGKISLLLKLAAMLRNEIRPPRKQQIIRWIDALTKVIDPVRVPGDFQDWCQRIEDLIKTSSRDVKDVMGVLDTALSRLNDILAGHQALQQIQKAEESKETH